MSNIVRLHFGACRYLWFRQRVGLLINSISICVDDISKISMYFVAVDKYRCIFRSFPANFFADFFLITRT